MALIEVEIQNHPEGGLWGGGRGREDEEGKDGQIHGDGRRLGTTECTDVVL